MLRKASGWTWPGFMFKYCVCKVATLDSTSEPTHKWPEKEAVDQRRVQPNRDASAAIYLKALVLQLQLGPGCIEGATLPSSPSGAAKAAVNAGPPG